MLPKNKRLNLSTEFKWVSSGKTIQSQHFRLLGKYGENQIARVGVAMNSKNFPKAHMRNKAKRIMFNAFSKIYDSLPKGLNIIALPKQGLDNVKSEELTLELEEALKKII